MDKLRLRVLDAHALGDPGFLGEAALDLRSLQLQPNAAPINIWLPLQARPPAMRLPHVSSSACCCCGRLLSMVWVCVCRCAQTFNRMLCSTI